MTAPVTLIVPTWNRIRELRTCLRFVTALNPKPTEIVIVDNGSYGSTGDQPTYAGKKTSLAAVARACGCENVVECKAEDTRAALETALSGDKMTIIVSKCDSGNIPVPVITMDPVTIRDRFMGAVKA